jgi:hypothetical protein
MNGVERISARWLQPLIIGALLVATLAVPAVTDRGVLTTAGLVASVVGVLLYPRMTARRTATAVRPRRTSLELLLHLSPVALLTVVFPVASARIGAADVGGVGSRPRRRVWRPAEAGQRLQLRPLY